MSYFVLREDLKKAALYVVRDSLIRSHGVAVKDHVSYETLGSVYGIAGKHNDTLRHALDQVCFRYETLPDSFTEDSRYRLIEARFAERRLFACGVSEIHLSPLAPPPSSGTQPERPLSGELWADIQLNAQRFAQKHGAKLIVMTGATTAGN